MERTLIEVLMNRENMTRSEVREWIEEVVEDCLDMDPEEMLHVEFGLEPDYVFDLMEFM